MHARTHADTRYTHTHTHTHTYTHTHTHTHIHKDTYTIPNTNMFKEQYIALKAEAWLNNLEGQLDFELFDKGFLGKLAKLS